MAEELSLNLERCPRVYFMALNDSLSLININYIHMYFWIKRTH